MLGLRYPTDPAWAQKAVTRLDELLVDHAHCELKAASNAMSLIARSPDRAALVLALTALAAEELQHFQQVHARLIQRGVPFGFPVVNTYAAELRRAALRLPSRPNDPFLLVDRLLVGALIEARSCERFKLVVDELAKRTLSPEEQELESFYHELFMCEARHYRTYVDLAKMAAGEFIADVDPRFDLLCGFEGEVVRRLRAQPAEECTMHG